MKNIIKTLFKRLVSYNNKLNMSSIASKIFTLSNINKILIIFLLGFISRIVVNNIYGINVFIDCFEVISIVYYICISFFIVIIKEFIEYFQINIIPRYIIDLYIIVIKMLYTLCIKIIFITKYIYTGLSLKNLNNINVSLLKKHIINVIYGGNNDKLELSPGKINSIKEIKKEFLSDSLVSNRNSGSSTDKKYSNKSGGNTTSNSNNNGRNSNSSTNNTNNNDLRGSYVKTNKSNDLKFVVETINDGNIDKHLATPIINGNNTPKPIPYPRPTPIAIPPYVNNYSPIPSSINYNTNYVSTNTSRFVSNVPVVNHINYIPLSNNNDYNTTNNVNYSPIPPQPSTPIMTNLSTPSTMSPLFPRSRESSHVSLENTMYTSTNVNYSSNLHYSSNIPHHLPVNNTNINYTLPATTYNPNYTLPATVYSSNNVPTSNSNYTSTGIEDFTGNEHGHTLRRANITHSSNLRAANINYNTDYRNPNVNYSTNYTNNTTNSTNNIIYSSFRNNSFALPQHGNVPYFNQPTQNTETVNNISSTRNTIGTSVESTNGENTNWALKRLFVENSMKGKLAEDMRGFSSKEVVIQKEGLLGKLKLGFKQGASKVDRIYIKYSDISKRKFVWTLWEAGSGNYESYEDFKRSWNPNTSIWTELKTRTKKDMKADIEDMLGVNMKNNKKVLDNIRANRLQSNARAESNITSKVKENSSPLNEGLVHDRPSTDESNNNSINDNVVDSSNKSKGKHRSGHKHKSTHNHSHSNGHKHGHKHVHKSRRLH